MSAPMRMLDRVIDSGVESGIEWATCSAPLYGAVNGYVLLPEGHPWRDVELQYEEPASGEIKVNGGITYGPTDEGWIGFDTLHSGDYWPEAPAYWDSDYATRWTPELVAEETKALARQAAEAQA